MTRFLCTHLSVLFLLILHFYPIVGNNGNNVVLLMRNRVFFAISGIDPEVLYMLDKHFNIEPHA